MADSRKPLHSGGCQCGAVRYAAYAPLSHSHFCHCRMCQRAVGNLFAALAGVNRKDFAWTKGEPSVYRSSSVAERGFCNKCGTPLSFRYLSRDRISVTLGSLDDPEGVPIERHIGMEGHVSWVKLCDSLPTHVTDTSGLTDMVNNQGQGG